MTIYHCEVVGGALRQVIDGPRLDRRQVFCTLDLYNSPLRLRILRNDLCVQPLYLRNTLMKITPSASEIRKDYRASERSLDISLSS